MVQNRYTIYRRDRSSRGGGVMIAVDSSISSKLLQTPEGVEIITINLCELDLTMCALYIPLNASTEYHTNLYDYLSSLCSLKNIMILGDFNSPDIDWLTFSSATAKSELLCDFTLEQQLNITNLGTHTCAW